jgi:ACR3 family arsenite efflux pump ArsB
MEALMNSYGRSLLIYIGTPMVAGGIWRKQEVEKKEKAIIK